MVLNDTTLDIKVKALEAKMSQRDLAKAVGTTQQYVWRVVHRDTGMVNKTFVRMMEELGYDIELTYVKRG